MWFWLVWIVCPETHDYVCRQWWMVNVVSVKLENVEAWHVCFCVVTGVVNVESFHGRFLGCTMAQVGVWLLVRVVAGGPHNSRYLVYRVLEWCRGSLLILRIASGCNSVSIVVLESVKTILIESWILACCGRPLACRLYLGDECSCSGCRLSSSVAVLGVVVLVGDSMLLCILYRYWSGGL